MVDYVRKMKNLLPKADGTLRMKPGPKPMAMPKSKAPKLKSLSGPKTLAKQSVSGRKR